MAHESKENTLHLIVTAQSESKNNAFTPSYKKGFYFSSFGIFVLADGLNKQKTKDAKNKRAEK